MLQTIRDKIVAPNHETPAAIGVLMFEDRLIVLDRDTKIPLCINALPYREESTRANYREVASHLEMWSSIKRRQTASLLCEYVNCGLLT